MCKLQNDSKTIYHKMWQNVYFSSRWCIRGQYSLIRVRQSRMLIRMLIDGRWVTNCTISNKWHRPTVLFSVQLMNSFIVILVLSIGQSNSPAIISIQPAIKQLPYNVTLLHRVRVEQVTCTSDSLINVTHRVKNYSWGIYSVIFEQSFSNYQHKRFWIATTCTTSLAFVLPFGTFCLVVSVLVHFVRIPFAVVLLDKVHIK